MKTVTAYGEAAFYGPKLDFMVRDALGRQWQLGTVQVDYNLPERFELEYIGKDNHPHRPVMIHRAPFGSLERFTSILIEHTGGKFPLWLTPEQFTILPISEKFNAYSEEVLTELAKHDIRGSVDDRNETIGRKIRDTELKRIPFMLIVGEKEVENGQVAVRIQGEGDKGAMTVGEFVAFFQSQLSVGSPRRTQRASQRNHGARRCSVVPPCNSLGGTSVLDKSRAAGEPILCSL